MKTLITAILLIGAILFVSAQEEDSDLIFPDEGSLFNYLGQDRGKNITLTDNIGGAATSATTARTIPTTTTQSNADRSCLLMCPRTPEFNPVCGNNNVVYQNMGALECARRCGLPDLRFFRNGNCPQPAADW